MAADIDTRSRLRWPGREARGGALARTARALLFAALAAGAAGAHAEKNFEQRLNALLGHWLAQSKDATQARVLRLTNVVFVEPRTAVLAGLYGPASAPAWPEARDISVRLEGTNIVLDVVAADQGRITLTTQADGSLQGAMPRAGAAAVTLRFARVPLSEIHRYAAENPLPEARAGRNARIELVYVGALDCSLCLRWEGTYLGQGKLGGSADWKHLRFTEVKLPTLKNAFRVEDAPARLQPVFHEMGANGIRIQGVPSFVLLVNDTLRAHALGPASFETLIHAALRSAVREKLAAERL
ncbi:MAG: hypothetical protein FJY54_18220 [Betaproteobacteria bacterium]|nr:hypothetical protein [Betaproteobacteria bacterium]